MIYYSIELAEGWLVKLNWSNILRINIGFLSILLKVQSQLHRKL